MESQLTILLKHEEEKLLACVHCGLCLEACPTYTLTNNENDSPRGRIYLMRAVEEERLAITSEVFSRHISRCLGCRACEIACPAGVEYGHLLESARAEITKTNKKKTFTDKILNVVLKRVWLKPTRLKLFFYLTRLTRDLKIPKLFLKTKVARLISKRFEFALMLLDSSNKQIQDSRFRNIADCQLPIADLLKVENQRSNIKDQRPKIKDQNRNGQQTTGNGQKVFLFTGCVMEGLFAHVNRATERVLKANDYEVVIPKEQVCCGALHAHAGDIESAKELAKKNIEAFSVSNSPIITNAGGCGAMLLSYAQLFPDDEKARDFSSRVKDVGQQLAESEIKQGAEINNAVTTYDASCHLHYGQHASESSQAMLRSIPDLKFVSLEGSDRCCGGAGIYNLLQPEMSAGVLEEKLKHIKETNAEILATGNPGCQMQITAGAKMCGMNLRVCHPVELLDESYRLAGYYEEAK
jgi:glycolate oxidase iron-sulfur subunit